MDEGPHSRAAAESGAGAVRRTIRNRGRHLRHRTGLYGDPAAISKAAGTGPQKKDYSSDLVIAVAAPGGIVPEVLFVA